MATERQRAANQRNAQSSTGPRGAGGKSRSARNAARHGLAGAQGEGAAALALYRLLRDDPAATAPGPTADARCQAIWALACAEAQRQAASAAIARCEIALEGLIGTGAFARTSEERALDAILTGFGITGDSSDARRAAVLAKLAVIGPLNAVDPVTALLERRRLLLRYRTEAEAARSRCLARLAAAGAV